MASPLLLSYSGCGTCKKALQWLSRNGIAADVRAIVERPPTLAELSQWVPHSGLPLRKWLNTSGQSYRALGKEKIQSADDATLLQWLSKDGKLVKRPVLVLGDQVLVGFDVEKYENLFSKKRS